jgi:hypothetical protein
MLKYLEHVKDFRMNCKFSFFVCSVIRSQPLQVFYFEHCASFVTADGWLKNLLGAFHHHGFESVYGAEAISDV